MLESPKVIKGYPVRELAHNLLEKPSIETFLTRRGLLAQRSLLKAGIERSLHTRRAIVRSGGDVLSSYTPRLEVFDMQFMDQREMSIDMGELGIQKAFGTSVKLPEWLIPPENDNKPPIFIIPAWSGDLYGIEPLMREAAMQGREVVSLAYPESYLGTPTEEFTQRAVQTPNSYEPHTEYFKQAIKQMVGGTGDFELWGYSTGGAIAAEILADSEFSQRATNAVLFSPTSLNKQSKASFLTGLGLEGAHLVGMVARRNLDEFVDISDVTGLKDKRPNAEEFNTRRKKIGRALAKKICHVELDLRKSRVRNGGKIVVMVTDKDRITKGYRAVDKLRQTDHDQLVVSEDKGTHLTHLTQAQKFVSAALAAQKT